MSQRLSGNSIYAQAITSLKSNYYLLMQGVTGKGLSLDNLLNPTDDAKKSTYMNYTFAQYMASNFASLDVDGDGVISESDMNKYTTQLTTTGLTYNQLAQLCSQGGGTLLETVLNNFSEIDRNKDGKVTNAEISAYGIEQESEEVKEKYPKYDLNAMSIYYTPSSSSKHETTTSEA